MLCIVCRKHEATVRDRNEGATAKKKKLCTLCHLERLRNDFMGLRVMEIKENKK